MRAETIAAVLTNSGHVTMFSEFLLQKMDLSNRGNSYLPCHKENTEYLLGPVKVLIR